MHILQVFKIYFDTEQLGLCILVLYCWITLQQFIHWNSTVEIFFHLLVVGCLSSVCFTAVQLVLFPRLCIFAVTVRRGGRLVCFWLNRETFLTQWSWEWTAGFFVYKVKLVNLSNKKIHVEQIFWCAHPEKCKLLPSGALNGLKWLISCFITIKPQLEAEAAFPSPFPELSRVSPGCSGPLILASLFCAAKQGWTGF